MVYDHTVFSAADITMSNLSLLHADTWQTILLCLDAPDILSLLQVNKVTHRLLNENATFWQALLDRETRTTTSRSTATCRRTIIDTSAETKPTAVASKQSFLQAAYHRLLPVVHWQALGHTTAVRIPGREAHLACVLSDTQEEEQVLVVTQGFTEDESIFVKPLSDGQSWHRLRPILSGTNRLEWAYGATLTPLSVSPYTAVRMGGCTEGGYSAMTGQVAVLQLTKDQNEEWRAIWEVKECTVPAVEYSRNVLARAYHAAQLVLDRYLVIMGGMSSRARGSILNPAVLDTRTWTWLDEVTVGTAGEDTEAGYPVGRHGCSLIWDAIRQRFVLFGGATGRDILRSGEDVCDVWQLAPQSTVVEALTHETFLKSLPWEWKRLHENQNRGETERDTERQEENSGNETRGDEEIQGTLPTRLSPADSLCLGRCHGSHLVARDTVMLVFGSSRPSSNGVLAYDLSRDEFRKPRITGCIPEGRLCFASSYLPKQSAIFVHSGWSTQLDGTIDRTTDTNMALLQLAPTLGLSHPFGLQASPVAAQPITDEDVVRTRRQRFNGQAGMHQLIMTLFAEDNPRTAANEWLVNHGPWSEQQAVLLHMLAAGHMIMRQVDDDSDVNDVDDDESYQADAEMA